MNTFFSFLSFLFLTFSLTPLLAENEEAYRLKPGDQISLSVYQEPDLSKTATLTSNGEATFVLIGALTLQNLTLQEASDFITKRFQDGYLKDPKVNLTLLQAASESVTVSGAVNAPRSIPIPQNAELELRAAISSAGGLSPHADPNQISLRRGSSVTLYSFSKLLNDKSNPVILQDGDLIEVFENIFANAQVSIYGYVKNIGSIKFPINGKLDLSTLIELAGGSVPGADLSAITIERNSTTRTVTNLDTTYLKPNDIIIVPANKYLGATVTMVGQINRPGKLPFSLNGKMSLLDAISSARGPTRLGDQRKITITRTTKGTEETFKVNADKMEKGTVPLFFLEPGDTISIPKRFF